MSGTVWKLKSCVGRISTGVKRLNNFFARSDHVIWEVTEQSLKYWTIARVRLVIRFACRSNDKRILPQDLGVPCSADRNGTDFMVEKRWHHFQELRILGWLNRCQRRFYRLLLFLLPYELPARDLHWRRRWHQGAVSDHGEHYGMGVVMRQTSLTKPFWCIRLR